MTPEAYEALVALDPVEQIAKATFEKTGKKMQYETYLVLREQSLTRPQEKTYRLFDAETGVDLQILPRYVDLGQRDSDDITLLYVMEGPVSARLRESKYLLEKGTIAYLPDHTPYRIEIPEDALALELHVEKEVFWELGLRDTFHLRVPMLYPTEEDHTLRDMHLLMLETQALDPELYAQTLRHLYFAMSTYVTQRYFTQRTDLFEQVYRHPQLFPILSYMAYHFDTVTLQELAERFHFSVPYLSGLIRKETGQTFSELLRDYRLERAERLLRESQLHISEIAVKVGFKEAAQFIRAFKTKHGVTPAKYRANLKEPWKYTKEQ